MNNLYKYYSQLLNMIEVTNLMPFLLVGFLIGICGLFEAPYDRSNMAVCDDDTCLKNNFQECAPAYGNLVSEDYDIYFEVRGLKDNGKCEVYIQLNQINSDKVPDEIKTVANLAKGSSMICEVNEKDKNKVLSSQFDSSLLENCNGVLANALSTVAPYFE